MFKELRNAAFLRLFTLAALVLAFLVFLNFCMAWPRVTGAGLSGTYHRASIRFLKVADLPAQLVLRSDGTMSLSSAAGVPVFEGTWHLDERERVLRVDDARWDRQIRVRSTLFGPRLSMRISPLPLEIDHPEHDEEVDLLPGAASPS
ncbi:MAG: hypothetical protein ABI599_11660 [Flavobacteriales bacterium]